jgi:fructose-specific phosphotransferase system IIC component
VETVSIKLRWLRVAIAVFSAEALPVLALVGVVVVYGFMRKENSLTPEEFAPLAGNWVGPIGGFIATFSMAWWAARTAHGLQVKHGLAVGVGTALLDLSLALAMSDGATASILLAVSNTGRIIAGFLGGYWARCQIKTPVRSYHLPDSNV